jgi:hypothetical protein
MLNRYNGICRKNFRASGRTEGTINKNLLPIGEKLPAAGLTAASILLSGGTLGLGRLRKPECAAALTVCWKDFVPATACPDCVFLSGSNEPQVGMKSNILAQGAGRK